MKRKLSTLCAAASLLAFVAACALWVRSYGGSDYLVRNTPDQADPFTHHAWKAQWTLGQVRLARERQTYYPPPSVRVDAAETNFRFRRAWWGYGRLGAGHLGWGRVGGPTVWNRLGFRRYSDGTGASFFEMSEEGVTAPAWLPVLLTAAPPAAWAVGAWRRRRRRTRGRCASCGYDLRATPARCPECGLSVVTTR